MVKTVSMVRTVLLCLAVCDVSWTRYLALDEDTEDNYLPETEVSLVPFCLFLSCITKTTRPVCYEFVNLLSTVVLLSV